MEIVPQGVANIVQALSIAGVVWRAGAPWRISVARSVRLWGRPRDAPAARGPPLGIVWAAPGVAARLRAGPSPGGLAPPILARPSGAQEPAGLARAALAGGARRCAGGSRARPLGC